MAGNELYNWTALLKTKYRGYPIFDGVKEIKLSKPKKIPKVTSEDCQTMSDAIEILMKEYEIPC